MVLPWGVLRAAEQGEIVAESWEKARGSQEKLAPTSHSAFSGQRVGSWPSSNLRCLEYKHINKETFSDL